VFVEDGTLARITPEDGGLALRTLPLAALDLGAGPLRAPLPDPYGALALRGDIDAGGLAARLAAERRSAAAVYGLAALILAAAAALALFAVERARRLARAKEGFVANVTHELKTPLANIRLYAESLHEGRVRAGDEDGFMRTILDEAARLDALVEGLLHAARGPKSIAVRLDPREVVHEAAARWRGRLEQEGFTFTVRVDDVPPVRGDPEAFVRALGNLLDNARKYDRTRRRVELSASAANGQVRLTVRDGGPGIPVAARARVLQPFARLEAADRKETEGVGLGLSLARSCVEAHGGRVEIGQEGGAGAAVSLVLPAAGGRDA